ncbi:MAG: S41 family peptidase [Flavobacteriales bacterium]
MKYPIASFIAILSFVGGRTTVQCQQDPLWLRQPAISPDGSAIVFTYKGDLWRVDAKGGTAQLLTTTEAYDADPLWSRDGEQLVFSSDRSGNKDVYVMPSIGGAATRLTFHSAEDVPSDVTPDGNAVLFYSDRLDAASNQQFPIGGFGELYQVPISGGRAQQLITTPAIGARFNTDGSKIVFYDVKGYEDELRKHHTSSVTRDIWTYDLKNGTYTQLSTFAGEDRHPLYSADGGTVYYLSEEKGTFNIFKMPATGGASTQVSFLTEHPVRGLSMSRDGTLCFSYRGELYTMKEGSAPTKVPVRIAMDDRFGPERTVSVKEADEMNVSPNGKEVVFVHRGEVFVTSVAEGTTRRITDTPEQERSASFSPDGRSILYASERNGSWDLYTTSLTRKEEQYFFNATVLKEEVLLATPAEEFQPAYSPDGKQVAYLEERTAVRVLDLATKVTRIIVPANRNYSYSDGDQYFAWSPDSKWLLVEFLRPGQWITQCGLVSATGGKEVIDLTHSGYDCFHPQWVMEGKAMTYLSARDGMRNHASWGGQADAYILFFTQDAYDDFKLSKEEAELRKEAKKEKEETEEDGKDKKDKKKKAEEEKKEVELLKFELDGIDDRKARLTPNSSQLSDVALSKDGEKLFYIARFEKDHDLWQMEVRTRETKVLSKLGAPWAGDLTLDKDGENLFFLAKGGISKVGVEDGEVKSVGINGEMRLNENAERTYLFEHVWRQVLKKFYRPDLHGVDWNAMKTEYARFLPHINNNNDFADVLSEMLGELNASHTGAGYWRQVENGDATASLGAFFVEDPTADGLRIAEVLKKGPLVKEGSKVKPGHMIEKIDGVALKANEDPSALLNRKAGKPTLLSIYDPATKTRWEERVEPISRGAERQLLYERWVERCRHLVDSLSGGTMGYVHVRGMNDQSYRTVYEEVLGRFHDKKALVVDTRFNGGGWLHDDLATFLSGRTYMHMEPRGQDLGTEPQFKWQRPSVVVMSESNYSDAHMFPVTYRALGIGKLVGMPVPGTGTAVWWEGLPNDMYFGIPQVGMIDEQGTTWRTNSWNRTCGRPWNLGLLAKDAISSWRPLYVYCRKV